MRSTRMAQLICAASIVLGAAPAVAQDYPNRPIQMIIPFAAGGVEFIHAPYRGDGPMQPDLLSGRLGFAGVLPSSFLGQVKAGNLRLLAMLPERRHPSFPEVPTLTESGIPVVQLSFGGVLVPAKMPPAMVATLEAACEKAVASPAMQAWATGASQVLSYANGNAFADRLRRDSAAKMATLKRLKLVAE